MNKKVLAVLLSCLCLIGCNEVKEVDGQILPITVKNEYFSGKNLNNQDITSSYSQILPGGYVQGEFKESDINEKLLKSLNDVNLKVKSIAEDNNVKDDSYKIISLDRVYENSLILSLGMVEYEYVQDPTKQNLYLIEANFKRKFTNIEKTTGEKLNLKDVLRDENEFLKILKSDFNYSKDSFSDSNWTIDPLGITVVDGDDLVYRVDFARYDDILNDKFKEILNQDSYIINLGEDRDFKLSLKDNGNVRDLELKLEKDDYDIHTYKIVYGESSLESNEDLPIYNVNSYLMVLNNKAFLFIDCTTDNDIHFTNVYSLSDKVQKTDSCDYGFFIERPVNPMDFKVSRRAILLSSYDCYREAFLNSEGKIAFKSDYLYAYDHSRKLSLKKDFKFDVVDMGGKVLKEAQVEKGKTFEILRTDNKNIVDLIDDEKNIYRVNLEFDEQMYPQFIKGENIDDIFDGIVFVG